MIYCHSHRPLSLLTGFLPHHPLVLYLPSSATVYLAGSSSEPPKRKRVIVTERFKLFNSLLLSLVGENPNSLSPLTKLFWSEICPASKPHLHLSSHPALQPHWSWSSPFLNAPPPHLPPLQQSLCKCHCLQLEPLIPTPTTPSRCSGYVLTENSWCFLLNLRACTISIFLTCPLFQEQGQQRIGKW